MKIYTKTGDDGTTSLFDGARVKKNDERVDLYGEVDELNAAIGLAAGFLRLEEDALFQERLYQIQRDLFALGAQLANPKHKKQKEKADFDEDKILRLETEIDDMEKSLKPMTNFILPGGTPASGALHLSRTICRRAERKLVHFMQKQEVDSIYIKFLNRLSDYLFVAARFANHVLEREDIVWE